MAQRPHNPEYRFSPRRLAWLAAAVVAAWMLLFLRHPVWPLSVAPADSDLNGPRWYLLLAPDSLLAGWFNGPLTLAGLGQRLAVLGVAAVILATAYAAGRPLVASSPPIARLTAIEKHLLAVAAGLSVCSLVTLLVGLAGGVGRLWSGPLIALLSILLGLGAGRFLAARGAAAAAAGRVEASAAGRPTDDPGRWHRSLPDWAIYVPGIAVGVLGCLLVARAMMPPAEYDVREYHLQAPKEWSLAGRIGFMPHNIYANMPMAAEMHALAAMDWWRLGGDDHGWWWWGALSGKVVIALYAVLAAGLVGCVTARFCGPVAGTWAVAFSLAMPALAQGATLGLIEGAVACNLAAGMVILASRFHSSDMDLGAAGWAGFFAGSAVACKYPAVLLVALPLGVATLLLGTSLTKKQRLASLLGFVLLAGIACGPWLIKNAVLAGNPVYPLAASLWGGRTMTAEKIAQWNAGHPLGPFTWGAAADALARLSWRMPTQSILVVPMAVAGLITGWRRPTVRYLAIGSACSLLAWWLWTHRVERFLVPTLPLVLVLAGFGWRSLADALGAKLLTAVALFGLVVDGLLIAGPVLGDSRIAVDLSYLRRDAGSAARMPVIAEHVRFINHTLDAEDRLLLVGDAAAFDYAVPLDYATTFDRSPLIEVVGSAPPERWGARLRQRGYSHLLVHWGEIQRLRSTYGFDDRIDRQLLATMQRAGAIEPLRMGLSRGRVDVYRVTANPKR